MHIKLASLWFSEYIRRELRMNEKVNIREKGYEMLIFEKCMVVTQQITMAATTCTREIKSVIL